jgi:hypothetical protein
MFVSDLRQRQYGRRQVMGRMVEPMHRRVMQRTVMIYYQVHDMAWYALGSVPSQLAA